jgi:hypothetical protein
MNMRAAHEKVVELKDGQVTALKKLREPFPPNQISMLPKPTKAQTEELKRDFKKGIRCDLCGQWHHPNVVHLSYVGHAALTDRLLDVDPLWSWEPLAFDESGLPALDNNGGLWIRLTVCGMTRIGYGDAPGKSGGDAMKERIGDALRNAGIRFGAALDLWHKGDLHAHENGETSERESPAESEPAKQSITDARLKSAIAKIKGGEYSTERLYAAFELTPEQIQTVETSLDDARGEQE